jgi:hypothetical protein
VAVDWKATPYLPAETVEWYRRITALAGTAVVASLADAEAGYARMDSARLAHLAARYGARYAVFRYPFDPSALPGRPVFVNRAFLVLRVNAAG